MNKLKVPLKTTNSYFDLYRIVILPQPIASNKHVQYSIYYTYFAILHSKCDYQLFAETAYNRCYRAVLPFARLTFQFLAHKLKRARWVHISGRQQFTIWAADNLSLIPKHQSFRNLGQRGSTTFQRPIQQPCNAETSADKLPTTNFFSDPEFYMTSLIVTFHLMTFKCFQNSMAKHKQNWSRRDSTYQQGCQ